MGAAFVLAGVLAFQDGSELSTALEYRPLLVSLMVARGGHDLRKTLL